MSGQETQLTKKRRGPAPTGVGTLVGVRLHPPQLAALDAWIKSQPGELSRPEAVRQLLGVLLPPAGSDISPGTAKHLQALRASMARGDDWLTQVFPAAGDQPE